MHVRENLTPWGLWLSPAVPVKIKARLCLRHCTADKNKRVFRFSCLTLQNSACFCVLVQNHWWPGPPVPMESELLIGWQREKAELQHEVCRLQEELAESRAEREELESRTRALNERVRKGGQGDGGHVTIRGNQTLTSLHLSPAVPVNVSLAGPFCETRGWAEGVEEEGQGGERERGQTGSTRPSTAEQGENQKYSYQL